MATNRNTVKADVRKTLNSCYFRSQQELPEQIDTKYLLRDTLIEDITSLICEYEERAIAQSRGEERV